MKLLSRICVLLCALALAACAPATGPVSPTVSDMRLDRVDVAFGPQIARTASGEEFSSNFLWAGGGDANRKRQVVEIFREAAADVAREAFTGARPVGLDVEVIHFHGMPEWARYLCCGMVNIRANLTLTDSATAQVLARGEDVFLGRVGLGGVPKVIAELQGRSERQLVKEAIVSGIRDWLSTARPPS